MQSHITLGHPQTTPPPLHYEHAATHTTFITRYSSTCFGVFRPANQASKTLRIPIIHLGTQSRARYLQASLFSSACSPYKSVPTHSAATATAFSRHSLTYRFYWLVQIPYTVYAIRYTSLHTSVGWQLLLLLPSQLPSILHLSSSRRSPSSLSSHQQQHLFINLPPSTIFHPPSRQLPPFSPGIPFFFFLSLRRGPPACFTTDPPNLLHLIPAARSPTIDFVHQRVCLLRPKSHSNYHIKFTYALGPPIVRR